MQYLNCSVRLFPARNKAANGSAVRIYTVCNYGVGFVAGLARSFEREWSEDKSCLE